MLEKAMPWLTVLGLFLLWEAAVWAFDFPEFILPAPGAIFRSAWRWHSQILEHSLYTLIETLVGFAVAIVGGVILGVIIGSSTVAYAGLYPVLIGFNSIPKVAVVPILVIWFGIGAVPAIITAFLLAFFPIVVNVATGIATVEPEMLDVLRALGARHRDIVLKVGIPRSLPYFFASLKVAITMAFVGSIVSETIASNKGVGYLIIVASSRFDVPLVFAGLLVTAVMGIGMYAIAAVFERRMTGWATRGMLGAEQALPG